MRHLFILLFLTISFSAFGATYIVGPNQTYPNPNALYQANILEKGDSILIKASTYIGQEALAVWNADNLFIQGINGRPHLKAAGAYIQGKGIWVIKGNNCTVENIEFSEAKVPDQNGAGIRLDGIGLILRHCYFHENENGLLTSNPYAGDIVIEYCEFENGGFGDGFSHNLYIGHVNSLTFRFNYSHHAKIGHALKSRAQYNYISYNRIMDEEEGYSSRLIDLPNGGTAVILGNILMQGPEAENSNMIGYGPEGLSNNAPHQLYVVNNTMVNKRANTGIFVSVKDGTDIAYIKNNIFAGDGVALNGMATEMDFNLIEENVDLVYLEDEVNYNYHLTADSPAIDQGENLSLVNGFDLSAQSHYVHNMEGEERQIINNKSDIGAYEFGEVSNPQLLSKSNYYLSPNPVSSHMKLHGDLEPITSIQIIQIDGNRSETFKPKNQISIHHLQAGIYILKLSFKDRSDYALPFLKS